MTVTQVYTRIATPSDREKLRGMLSRSSTETVYRRFHIPYPEVPGWVMDLMLGVDLHQESLVAVAEGRIVGHAMYVRLEDEVSAAEMAIVVEDGWQSKGVGKSLLLELARRARLREIETFTAEVLGQNRRMLGLAATFPGTDYTTGDGVCRVRMPLQEPVPAARPHTVRRAA